MIEPVSAGCRVPHAHQIKQQHESALPIADLRLHRLCGVPAPEQGLRGERVVIRSPHEQALCSPLNDAHPNPTFPDRNFHCPHTDA